MCLKNIHFLKSLYCRSKYLNNKQLSDVLRTGIFIVRMHCAFFFCYAGFLYSPNQEPKNKFIVYSYI